MSGQTDQFQSSPPLALAPGSDEGDDVDHAVRYVGRFHVHRPPELEAGVPIDCTLVVDAGLVAIPSGSPLSVATCSGR
jgi:hypothetical protein